MSDQQGEDETYDARVGRNVQELRKARGMTQEQLASAVSERGIPCRQQTIVKIEKGRPLKLREAQALAGALDVDLDDLVDEPYTIDQVALLLSHVGELTTRWESLRIAARALILQRGTLQGHLDWIKSRGIAVPDHVLGEAATLLQVDPMKVVESAYAELKAEREVAKTQFDSAVTYIPYEDGEPKNA